MISLDEKLKPSTRRFSFDSGAYPLAAEVDKRKNTEKFEVVKLSGTEAISQTFRFDLILVCEDTDIDFEKMLLNPATLTIYGSVGVVSEKYHGVLSEVEQLHQAGNYVFYRVVLASRLQRLNLFRTSDVHVGEQTIPEVLAAVIKSSALTSGDFENKLIGNYRKRDFVCQYQETNLDFISRWMEKEGIYYFFDHSGPREKLVLVDAASMQPSTVQSVAYRPPEEVTNATEYDCVQSFVCRQKPLPKQVVLQGFNYNAAAVELKQVAPVSDTGVGDVMLYGENFLTEDEGKRYAKIRAEEILCSSKVFYGEATAVGLRSGHGMKMTSHYRNDFNRTYLVTEVDHFGSQAGALLAGIRHPFGGNSEGTDYSVRFRAIDFDQQFRPARSMPRPHIGGSVTAIVDAEGSGQYADMDELGRYKVRLPFSKTGKGPNQGSARIRMATPYSGSGYGANFPLHKGAEVLLSFVDGDPDQPVIVNAVPDSENKSVINSSNRMLGMVKTAGGNSLVFDDTENQQSSTMFSPLGSSQWRVGQKATGQMGVAASSQATWGDARQGLHGKTKEDIGLSAGKALVLTAGVGADVLTTQAPVEGDIQLLSSYALINIGNQALPAPPAPAPSLPAVPLLPSTVLSLIPKPITGPGSGGSLDIYAEHINMFAEPTKDAKGKVSYGYILQSGGPKQGAGSAWGLTDLYALQDFTVDYNASLRTKAAGRIVVLGGSKTTYTQGHSNSATYGDSSSVSHGNNVKLVHGTDQSHTYGVSSSIFFGNKNDLTVGLTNSVFVGAKTDTSASAKLTMALSAAVSLSIGAELKASLSATAEFAGGIKTGVNTVVDVSAKAIAAKAAATEFSNSVAYIANKTMHLQNEVNKLDTSVFRMQMASINIFT